MTDTIIMTCKECKKTKSVECFTKNMAEGPLLPWNMRKKCTECLHVEYLERYQNPTRRRALNKSSRNWKKAHKEEHTKLARDYRTRHPEKIIAQNRLNYAISKNRIKRQPCEVCGINKNVQAHHISYKPEDWYNVKWLCRFCHEIEHG